MRSVVVVRSVKEDRDRFLVSVGSERRLTPQGINGLIHDLIDHLTIGNDFSTYGECKAFGSALFRGGFGAWVNDDPIDYDDPMLARIHGATLLSVIRPHLADLRGSEPWTGPHASVHVENLCGYVTDCIGEDLGAIARGVNEGWHKAKTYWPSKAFVNRVQEEGEKRLKRDLAGTGTVKIELPSLRVREVLSMQRCIVGA